MTLDPSTSGSGADLPDSAPLLWGTTSTFRPNAMTWAQPIDAQDATAIDSILPPVLSQPSGVTASFI